MAKDTASAENGSEDMWVAGLPPPMTPVEHCVRILPIPPVIRERRELQKEESQLCEEHRNARLAQHIARKRVDMAIEEEETHLYVLQRTSEQRRLRFKNERQEQSCCLCGHRFNYTHDGTLLPENTWCDVRQEHCSTKGNLTEERINPHCIQKAKAKNQADARARKQVQQPKKKTSRAKHPGSRQPVSTHGHLRALASTDQEPL